LPSQVVTGYSTTLTAVRFHEKVDPGAQCVCIRGYIYRSPPSACQYTGGVSPSPRQEQRRGSAARDGCQASTANNINILLWKVKFYEEKPEDKKIAKLLIEELIFGDTFYKIFL
jgi:hypothetical protein